MTGELAGMLGQQLVSEVMSHTHHRPWRLAGPHPTVCSHIDRVALLNKPNILKVETEPDSHLFRSYGRVHRAVDVYEGVRNVYYAAADGWDAEDTQLVGNYVYSPNKILAILKLPLRGAMRQRDIEIALGTPESSSQLDDVQFLTYQLTAPAYLVRLVLRSEDGLSAIRIVRATHIEADMSAE